MIAFRVGATDAELLEKEFAPVFVMEDLVNLGFAQIYLKLMIDGLSSQPFSATTLPPIAQPDSSFVKEIIDASREQFARPRSMVEEVIAAFHEPTPKPAVQKSPSPAINKKDDKMELPKTKPITSTPASVPNSVKVDQIRTQVKTELNSPQNLADLPKPADVDHLLKKENKIQDIAKKLGDYNSPKVVSENAVRPQVVTLSSLANRKPKIDHKVQTQKNVSDLKSALSAVLAKAKEGHKVEDKKVFEIKEQSKDIKNQNEDSSGNQIMANTIVSPDKPKEVPEEVLNKILN
jgi:hypothetical protein